MFKQRDEMGPYLSDDLYRLPDFQHQLIFIHGVVGIHNLAFPGLFHPLRWKDKESSATSTDRYKVSKLLLMLMEKEALSGIGFNMSNPSEALFLSVPFSYFIIRICVARMWYTYLQSVLSC